MLFSKELKPFGRAPPASPQSQGPKITAGAHQHIRDDSTHRFWMKVAMPLAGTREAALKLMVGGRGAGRFAVGGGGLCGRGWTWSARDRASVSSKTRGGSICVRWSSQAWVQGQKTNRSPTPRAEGRESKQSNQEAATCKWWRMMLHLRRTRWNTRRGRGVPRFAPPTDPHKQAEQRE